MIDKALVLAMILTESGFNPSAVSSEQAKGLLQITDIAVKELHQVYGWPRHPDLFNAEVNIIYGVKLLEHYQKTNKNRTELLAEYNGGSRQRNKIRSAQPLATETLNYIHRVSTRAHLIADYLRVCPDTPVRYAGAVDKALARRGDPIFKRPSRSDFQRYPEGLRLPNFEAPRKASKRCGSLTDWVRKGEQVTARQTH